MFMSVTANATSLDESIISGKLEEANRAVEAEIAKNPNEAHTWIAYAKLWLAKNDTQKSWAGLSQARKILSSDSAANNKNLAESQYYQIEGAWYFQKKDFVKSIQSFKQGLTFDPNNLESNLWLVCALLADHKMQEVELVVANLQATYPKDELVGYLSKITHKSEKELQSLIKNHPNLLAPKVALIDLYIQQGQYNAAKKILDKSQSSELSQLPMAFLNAHLSLILKQPQEVVNKLNPIIQTNEDYRLLGLLSVAYSALGNFEQASKMFEKSLKAKEDKIPDFVQTAMPNVMGRNMAYFDQLIINDYYQTKSSLMPSGLVKIAFYYKKNQLVNAKQEARKWVEVYPRQAFSYDVLGSVNKAEGDYHSAESAFKSAIKLNETYFPARLHLVDVLIKQRKYHEARKLLLDTSKKFKPDSKLFLLWSKLEEFEGNRDAAKKWLEKAASVEQGLEPGLEFVSFYLRQDRPKLALMLAENLAKHHGNDIRLLNLLGGLYLENTHNYEQATEIYEKLAQFLPNSPSVVQNLSKSHQFSGHPEKAVSVLEHYLAKYPDQVAVERQLARLYIHNKNFDKAKLAFERILQSHPDDFTSLNNLANLYIEIDSKKSLAFAKQAYDHASTNAAVCDTLGWSYYKNGETIKGLTYLHKAHKLDPNLADATYHLAIVTREQGQKQAAVTYLKQALASTDDQFSARTQANKLLQNWSS